MTALLRAIELKLGVDEALPTEFRIFSLGEIDTTKGVFTFDAAAAKRVLDAFAAYANDLVIDYNHGTNDPSPRDPAEAGKAAGWFRPEMRDDGLWATGVTWTPLGAAKLRAREYRYFSPSFQVDDEGHITELFSLALTTTPATIGMTPLVAERTKPPAAPVTATVTTAKAAKENLMDAELMKACATACHECAKLCEECMANPNDEALAEKCRAACAACAELCAKCAGQDMAKDDKELPPEALARFRVASDKLATLARERDEARAALAKIEFDRKTAEFVGRAERLKALSQDPKILGPALLELSARAPTSAKIVEDVLAVANAALEKSHLFVERGIKAGVDDARSAYAQLNAEAIAFASESAKAGKYLSREQAIEQISRLKPELKARYDEERLVR